MKIIATAMMVAGLLATSASVRAQTRLTETQAREFARDAAAEAYADEKAFRKAFEKRVKTVMPKYRSGTMRFGYEAVIFLAGQVAAFQENIEEKFRKLESVDDAEWPSGPVVWLTTTAVTAPDIEQVVVVRNKTEIVKPTESQLQEMPVQGLGGAVVTKHHGFTVFDRSTFEPAPKTKVEIMLIPVASNNLRYELTTFASRIYDN